MPYKDKEKQKEYYLNNKKNIQEYKKQWALKNKEKIKQIYTNCPVGYHVDHIIPLNNSVVCGFHVESNLQYLTAKENMRKSNKFTLE